MQFLFSNKQEAVYFHDNIEREVERIVKWILDREGVNADELSCCFVTGKTMSALHDQLFGDPSVTDCIAIPIDGEEEKEYRVLGEIIVCPSTALEYVQQDEKKVYEETTLYVIHALLHLIGYNDQKQRDITIMREKEQIYMNELRQKGWCLEGEKGIQKKRGTL